MGDIDINNQVAQSTNPSFGSQLTSQGISALGSLGTNYLTSAFDTEAGGNVGQVLGSAFSSMTNTMSNNIMQGNALIEGMGRNVGASLAGTGMGIAGKYIGKGISKIGDNSRLSRGIGQGVATGIGSLGGTMLGNLISTGNIAGNAGKLFGTTAKMSKLGAINPYGLAGQVIGTGLQAAFGPSKEYEGTYGNITKGMDTAYDLIKTGVGFIPGYGQLISGMMELNKGLSNVFGSTSGMTRTDAILGSAFMPAPVKWLNMAGARTTNGFNNQSWQNTEKANSFMQNAFGDLQNVFEKARKEAGKTYGTFSRKAFNQAADRNSRANRAWDTVLSLADQNELQNIRSQAMTSINNQRYAQAIQGGYSPLARGKQGMKIVNNATNHNMGMRLLSAAALIDDKQMILSAKSGTKARKIEKDDDDHTYEMEPMQEVVVTAKRKYIAGYDKNGNPIYTENPQKSMGYTPYTRERTKYQEWANRDKNAPKYSDAFVKAAQGLIGAPLATIAGAPVVEAISSGVGAAAKALAPGSSFWMNPITKQMVTGTAMSEGVNLANKAVNGYNTVGEGVGDLVQRATGWNPNNTWLGPLVTEAFNPGWYVSPNGVINTVGKVEGAVENIPNLVRTTADKLGFFIQKPGTYTRGIGITDAGLKDAIETGVIRGNPRGTELTAKQFTKGYERNRDHFRDIMDATGIKDIASKFQSRTLSEEEFNAIKEASKNYTIKRLALKGDTFTPKELPADPLYEYSNYEDYVQSVRKTIADVEKMPTKVASGEVLVNSELTPTTDGIPHGRPIIERFGPNSDYVGDGHPLSYWYDDGRNPITRGHSYARSNYGIRVNNPEDYQPFMHEMHLHPSFFRTPRLSDPNVEVFKKGLFGITRRVNKEKLLGQHAPTITPENAASITPEQWTTAQDAAIARGDMAEAQRLRDLHSKLYGEPIVGYHGLMLPNEMYRQRELNPYSDIRRSRGSSGYFSSTSESVANTYNIIDGSPTFKLYTHLDNPYIIDASGKYSQYVPYKGHTAKTDYIYNDIMKTGKYDGIIFKNIIDVGPKRNKLNGATDIADDIVSSPGRSKLADAVTYDDNGVRIPLGERDNFNINDIRYGLLPFVGVTGAATLHNKSK